MESKNTFWIIIIAVLTIIVMAVILFLVLRKKDRYDSSNSWDCNPGTGKCHEDPVSAHYSSKNECLRDRNNVCGKNAWDCNPNTRKCHKDPYGGPYQGEQDCLQNSYCGSRQPLVPFDPTQVKFTFTPFGKNSCSGTNCPTGQLNPGFYKICMLGNLQSPTVSECDQDALAKYIVDNYNCISPPITQIFDTDGAMFEDPISKKQNVYFAGITAKVVKLAASQGKLIVIMPIIYGTAAILPMYNNLEKPGQFQLLHDSIIGYFDRNFVKGIIYDIETWDIPLGSPYKDGRCPRDGQLAQLVEKANCWKHEGCNC